jgi:hypothetical protein
MSVKKNVAVLFPGQGACYPGVPKRAGEVYPLVARPAGFSEAPEGADRRARHTRLTCADRQGPTLYTGESAKCLTAWTAAGDDSPPSRFGFTA